MAKSSFDYFRKHTKVAVVALGALCMLAFVVADPLMQYLSSSQMGRSSADRGKVAVSWSGGKLTEGELGTLIARRQILAGFLRSIAEEGQYMAMQAGVPGNVPARVRMLDLPTQRSQSVEQDVLQTKLFAEAAKKQGMAVSDAALVDYLSALGRDYVSRDRMRELIGSIQLGNGTATPEFMFELLREALLARDYIGSFMYSRATVMPEQRWNDWLKANDRVVVEAAELTVADFVDQVNEPTEAQVAAYYEEYKATPPGMVRVQNTMLPSPTPGFRVPSKAKLQYVKADFASAVEAAKPEITDEQVTNFYEANQEMFVDTSLDLIPDEDDIQATDSEEPATADEESSAEPMTDPNEAEASEDAASEEAASVEPTTEEANPEADSEPQPEQSGALPARSPFRLAAFQNNDSSETPEDQPKNELDEFLSGPEATEATSQASDAAESEAEKEEAAEEVKYKPIDEVRDLIVDRLAEQKAMADLSERLKDLRGLLKRDYNAYFTQRIDAEAENQPIPEPKPSLVDWQKLAADNGMEHGETELLTFFELRDTDTGKLYVPGNQDQQVPPQLALQAFRKDGQGIEALEPAIAFDLDKNQYLVQVLEVKEELTPELDEIRDQVVAAWKLEQAAELAQKRAEELAAQAEASGKALSEELADTSGVTVKETDRFAWLEPFTVNQYGMQAVRLGRPGTVEAAGPDFMEAVFSLGPNEVGYALNHDKTAAYVVRVALRESSQEELRQNFLRDWNDPRLRYAMDQQYHAESARAVFYELTGGEAPDWKRTPDAETQDEA